MEPMADANNLEQAMMRRAKTQSIPLNGSLELTPLCNLNCEMCYVRLSREEMERQGRLRTVEEWLDSFDGIFSIYEVLPQILDLWKLTNRTTSVPKKK